MKVLIVEPQCHWAGHSSMYTKYLCKRLLQVKANVSLLTYCGVLEDWHKGLAIRHIDVCRALWLISPILRLPDGLRRFKKLSSLAASIEFFFTMLFLMFHLRGNKYEAVHFIDGDFKVFYFFSMFARGEKFIYNLNLRGIFSKALRLRDLFLFRSLITSSWNRINRRNNISFICHSEFVLEGFRDNFFFKDKIVCIPWGIDRPLKVLSKDAARKELKLPAGEFVFLFFGVNHPKKDNEIFFRAIKGLIVGFKILTVGKIVFAGNNPVDLARRYDWSDNLIVVDEYVPEEDLPKYFCASDVLILSYSKDFFESSGVLSHACQYLLPVIATGVGQMGEYVEKSGLGLTFVPEDASSLRKAIDSFIGMPEERKALIRGNLAEFARKNSWEAVARKHLEYYAAR
jgi:glycosyltransferase involved in cell wall biosynthesis